MTLGRDLREFVWSFCLLGERFFAARSNAVGMSGDTLRRAARAAARMRFMVSSDLTPKHQPPWAYGLRVSLSGRQYQLLTRSLAI